MRRRSMDGMPHPLRHRTAPGTDLHAVVPTAEGRLEVVARHIDDRWWVVARCGRWRGIGVGGQLGPAVDAALGPYAGGVNLSEPGR